MGAGCQEKERRDRRGLFRASGAVLSGGALLLLAGSAAGEEAPEKPAAHQESIGKAARQDFIRPYGAIEFGLGLLALPDADICGEGGCDTGDISLEVDAWPIFRATPRLAVGAGITLGLTPAQEPPQQEPVRFGREHSRRYFMVEGVGRYYFLHGRSVEFWTGFTGGLVVVSDNFRSAPGTSQNSTLGSNSANIATEGLTLGLATGLSVGLNDQLQLGGTIRLANWFLPSDKEVIAFGEEASLADRVTMVQFALSVAYHAR